MAHDHARRSQPGRWPGRHRCIVLVGDTPISEAEIAREMQHHRADDPHGRAPDAATRTGGARTGAAARSSACSWPTVEPIDGETAGRSRRPRADRARSADAGARRSRAAASTTRPTARACATPTASACATSCWPRRPPTSPRGRRAQRTGEELIGALAPRSRALHRIRDAPFGLPVARPGRRAGLDRAWRHHAGIRSPVVHAQARACRPDRSNRAAATTWFSWMLIERGEPLDFRASAPARSPPTWKPR